MWNQNAIDVGQTNLLILHRHRKIKIMGLPKDKDDMKKKKLGRGYIVYTEDKPIKQLNQGPVWYSRTQTGLPVIIPEDKGQDWVAETGRPVRRRLKKYDYEEL